MSCAMTRFSAANRAVSNVNHQHNDRLYSRNKQQQIFQHALRRELLLITTAVA